ncbi:MAG: hypothetical protein HYW47_02680 [Deltaproteobacteria bacterium]|nr:hypothetical protein [Deltaproteobacteria bacterium]
MRNLLLVAGIIALLGVVGCGNGKNGEQVIGLNESPAEEIQPVVEEIEVPEVIFELAKDISYVGGMKSISEEDGSEGPQVASISMTFSDEATGDEMKTILKEFTIQFSEKVYSQESFESEVKGLNSEDNGFAVVLTEKVESNALRMLLHLVRTEKGLTGLLQIGLAAEGGIIEAVDTFRLEIVRQDPQEEVKEEVKVEKEVGTELNQILTEEDTEAIKTAERQAEELRRHPKK